MSDSTTRDLIVEAADGLFYRQGYERTSFAHIADAVRISRGNFYHHFRSKDEILQAVIDRRLGYTRQMLAGWEEESAQPLQRLRCFVRMLVANRADIGRHGCPVGTLCAELARLDHAAREQANGLMALFRGWLRVQFLALGHADAADALAMHLLARSQGIATLAQAFGDEAFIEQEARLLLGWLDQAGAVHPTPPVAGRQDGPTQRSARRATKQAT